MAYCEVCAWSLETGDGTTRDDLNRAMIDHHVETGHAPIETTDASNRSVWTTDGSTRPSDSTDAADRSSGTPDGSKRPSTDRPDWARKR